MDKIESRLTFSEHHEEIGRRNLQHKQICGLILLVNKDEYEIGVFNEVTFAAVRVRVHSNKLIINAEVCHKGSSRDFSRDKRRNAFFGFLVD